MRTKALSPTIRYSGDFIRKRIDMENLTDDLLKEIGFDTSKEPFTMHEGRTKIYKNYVRDGSGDYNGYIVEHPKLKMVASKGALIDFLIDK